MSKIATTLHHEPAPFEDQEERVILTKLIMGVFEKWQLPTKEQLGLLGLGENSRYMLQRYKKQQSTLPFEKDKLDRASLLLAIYENLYALFPENENLRNRWLTSHNKMLNNQSPIVIMISQGLIGIAKIARFLEFQMVH